MWYTVYEWLQERNWWRVAFWTVGLLETYQVTTSEGYLQGLLQISFWWAFMQISQNVLLQDIDKGVDKPKWY